MSENPPIQKISVNCDFSETALEHACRQLGGVPLSEVRVVTSYENRNFARELQAQFGFDLTLVPSAILRSDGADYHRGDVWCVEHAGGIVWSPGGR